MTQNLSTTFHPQTDGLSKRKNQWVEQYLHLFMTAQQDDWDEWLTVTSVVHNGHTNTTLGMTPNEALFGFHPNLYPRNLVSTPNKAVENCLNLLHQKRAQATAAINKAARTPYVIKDIFKVRDQVWLDAKNLVLPYRSNKLAPRRQGPFSIKRIISPVAFQLVLPPSWRIHDIFHASLLTHYMETPAHGPNYARLPPELVEEDPEYKVKAIINHHFYSQGRQLQYLIKWKGYPHSNNTWEPVSNLHTNDLLSAYHCKHPLGDKSKCKVQVCTLSNWTPQSTPSISLLTLSSRLLVSIMHPTGRKHLSMLPSCLRIQSTCPPSHPIPPRPHLLVPPSLMSPCYLPALSLQPSMDTQISQPPNYANSFTIWPLPFRPGPPNMPHRSLASKTGTSLMLCSTETLCLVGQ